MDQEDLLWKGTPSQVVNCNTFIVCGLFFWLVIPALFGLWRYLVVRCTEYELSSERLRLRQGVFNKTTEEIELYRVKDTSLLEPFFLRMFSVGNIILHTSDRTHAILVLEAIHTPREVKDKIRNLVEAQRRLKGVREID